MLTLTQAEILLASISESPVEAIEHMTNTNDVFKVVTKGAGNYFVKFHTSSWYKEALDTHHVVQREAAVAEMLKRKGIPLDYHVWMDCTRGTVDRSVLITSELPGISVTTALEEAQEDRDQIVLELAGLLKLLHELEFSRAGYIEFCEDPDMSFAVDPEEGGVWWDSHPCQKPENLKRYALSILVSKADLLPASLLAVLRERFERIPNTVAADYRPPCFVINNYHPCHIHMARDLSGWRITGLYDFEAASAGNSMFDLVGNELQLTPILGDLRWRSVFYSAYGRWPALETYKTLLTSFLLIDLGATASATVPDTDWLVRELPNLISATDWEHLNWYPGPTTG